MISFFRCYYNFELKLINSNYLIVKNYLKKDCFLDLIEAIPFFIINKYICLTCANFSYSYKYEVTTTFYVLQLSNLFKILKVFKILGIKKNQALDFFLELISKYYNIERAFLLIIDAMKYIGIIHCFVCVHIFIGKHSYSNWLILAKVEDKSFIDIYTGSLYFLITTLTTVGYGDITCSSFEERIFQIILLALGSIFYSYIISSISNFIQNDSNAKTKYNYELNVLENIRISNPNISFKLYKKILKYLEKKSKYQEKIDINSLIETLPFALKKKIMFTIYRDEIKHFKFFKKNENSEFISEVLNNFIPTTSKKSEFLIYEGEIVEEMIFIKDGRISLEAAINLDNPSNSIKKYFYEKFSEFNNEKEINESQDNTLIKTGYVSMMDGSITYDKAKTKIVKALQKMNFAQSDKNIDSLDLSANSQEKKDKIFKFDVTGGAIKNEEGNYQYLKILDIRKNEHFGIVFMTLNKPCPLTLQVKSKFAELFLLKKSEAINISKSYSNIWKRLYSKEFHNLISIKNQTFKALIKYKEINQLLINLNLEEAINNNADITVNDLNEIKKSIILVKKKKFRLNNNSTNKQSIILKKKNSSNNVNLNLNESLRCFKAKYSFNHNSNKNLFNYKLKSNSDKNNNKYSKLFRNHLTQINPNISKPLRNRKKVHFADEALLNKIKHHKNNNIINNDYKDNEGKNSNNNIKLKKK